MIETIVKVWGSNTHKRTYFNGVTCNGYNLIAPWGAPAKTCERFEVVEVAGGYDRGDGNHAWEATYVLRIHTVVEPQIKKVGRQLNGCSDFQIISQKVLG